MKKDLFEFYEELPKHIQDIIAKYGECDTYKQCEGMLKELNKHGYTFNYYLDACPYNLRKMVSNKTKHLDQYFIIKGNKWVKVPFDATKRLIQLYNENFQPCGMGMY